MALSGSQSILVHNNCHKLIVEWSASQNVGGNYSTVTANLYVQGTQGWSTIYSGSVAKSVALVINGNRKNGTARIDINGTEKRLLLSHTVNVPHNADGSKSFRIEGMWNPQITWSGTYYGSEEWTRQDWILNAIPRASTFNQTSDTFNMDGEGTIYINPASTSFRHKLYMHFGNKRPLLNDNPPVNQFFNVRFSASEFASQIPNATSGVGTLTLETYNGNTLVGSSSRQTYLNLPSNYVPSQPSVSVSDESSVPAKLGVSKTAGFYVKGMSLLRFSCSSSGVLGSTITSYQVQIDSQTFSSGSGAIDIDLSKFDIGVGKVKAIVTVTDSRGRSNSKTLELNIREYQAPKILNFSVSRQNNSDTVIITKKAKAQKIVSSNRTVLTTNYEYSQGAIDTYSKSGYTGTWNTSTSLSNLSVGEVVLLQLYNTSRCDYDLIIASVNTINGNSVNTTSVGLDNSTNYNSYTVRTEYKLSSADTWTTWRTETDSSATINSSGWDVTKSYDIRVILADKLNQTVVMASISTSKTLVSYYKDIGVGIGKMWERGVLDVGGDTYVNGTLDSATINGKTIKQNGRTLLDTFYPVGSIFITTVSTNPSSYMGGTWVRFGNGQTLVGVNESDGDFNTVQKTGGEKQHTLTQNEMPSHSHEAREVNGHRAYFWAWSSGPHPSPTLWIPGGNVSGGAMPAGGNPLMSKQSWEGYTTTNTGGGKSHNNLQPYITVYMWRRTA